MYGYARELTSLKKLKYLVLSASLLWMSQWENINKQSVQLFPFNYLFTFMFVLRLITLFFFFILWIFLAIYLHSTLWTRYDISAGLVFIYTDWPSHTWIPGDNSPMLIINIFTRNKNNKMINLNVNWYTMYWNQMLHIISWPDCR